MFSEVQHQGIKTGGLFKRFLGNSKFFICPMEKATFKMPWGRKIPDNFQQAKDLTAEVVESLKAHPQYGDSQLTLSGHSKGGAEAAYAALSQTTPLEARIFSSAELHQKLLDTIPQENLNQATDLITGANIKGDFIPNMRKNTSYQHTSHRQYCLPCHRLMLIIWSDMTPLQNISGIFAEAR